MPIVRVAFASVALLLLLAGCSNSQPVRETAPAIDPAAAGAEAIKQYDENKDGAISGAELDKVPAIKDSIKHYASGDGKVTAETIAARIREWQDSKVGVMSTMFIVKLDGKPLEGASVTLEPEKFLGGAIESASGVTNAIGGVTPQLKDKPGARIGLYKVVISKQADGKESIPARYNSATTLGIEVAPGNAALNTPTFELKSK